MPLAKKCDHFLGGIRSLVLARARKADRVRSVGSRVQRCEIWVEVCTAVLPVNVPILLPTQVGQSTYRSHNICVRLMDLSNFFPFWVHRFGWGGSLGSSPVKLVGFFSSADELRRERPCCGPKICMEATTVVPARRTLFQHLSPVPTPDGKSATEKSTETEREGFRSRNRADRVRVVCREQVTTAVGSGQTGVDLSEVCWKSL